MKATQTPKKTRGFEVTATKGFNGLVIVYNVVGAAVYN